MIEAGKICEMTVSVAKAHANEQQSRENQDVLDLKSERIDIN